MQTIITILLTVLIFGFLIFIHEFGHFIVAKICDVKVNEFALGMGPKIFSFKKGETQYSLRALPIGGYVSMEGENEDSDDPRSFKSKHPLKRIAICSAGVIMNFILGLLIAISLVAAINTDAMISTTISKVITPEGTVSKLKEGDKILSISGYKINVGEDITFGVSRSDPTGKTELIELETEFVVIRDGKKIKLEGVKPFVRVEDENGEKEDRYAFYVKPEKKTVLNVIKHGFFEAVSYVRTTVLGLCDLVTGRVGIDSLGGVVKIGQVVGEASKLGLKNVFYIMALISVNLGVMNLIPIPALDGGRIVLLCYELIFKKPINKKVEEVLIGASMLALIALMILVTFKDIISIF